MLRRGSFHITGRRLRTSSLAVWACCWLGEEVERERAMRVVARRLACLMRRVRAWRRAQTTRNREELVYTVQGKGTSLLLLLLLLLFDNFL